MLRTLRFVLFTLILLGISNLLAAPANAQTAITADPAGAAAQAQAANPVFRFPVVPAAEISSYFDHDPAVQSIQFYDGRAASSGFVFSCPSIGDSWVGCTDAAGSEATCADASELWYDEHHGIDFEYTTFWRTGESCDLSKFSAMTVTVLAPAAGIIDLVGEGDPYNGNYIRMYHDLDGDGNYYNDNLRSYYLHFADNGILVDEGQEIAQGDALGYGDMSGLAWTPHLHFEVQQRTDLGWVAVDPFGWQAATADPWHVASTNLWQQAAVVQTP
jgi:hypothetical protein